MDELRYVLRRRDADRAWTPGTGWHGIVTGNRAGRRTGRFVDDVIISGRYELAAHHLDPSCAARKGVQLALAKRQVGWDGRCLAARPVGPPSQDLLAPGFHATDPGFSQGRCVPCAPAPTAQVMAGGGQAPRACRLPAPPIRPPQAVPRTSSFRLRTPPQPARLAWPEHGL